MSEELDIKEPQVVVRTPMGVQLTLPISQAFPALANGAQMMGTEELHEKQLRQEQADLPFYVPMLYEAVNTASLGGLELTNRLLSKAGGPETEREFTHTRQYMQETHPTASTVGKVLGVLTPAGPAAGLVGLGGKVARGVEGALGSGTVAGLASGGIRGLAEGAGFGAAEGLSRASISDKPLSVDGVAHDIFENGIHGALIGGPVGAGFGAIGNLSRGIREANEASAGEYGAALRQRYTQNQIAEVARNINTAPIHGKVLIDELDALEGQLNKVKMSAEPIIKSKNMEADVKVMFNSINDMRKDANFSVIRGRDALEWRQKINDLSEFLNNKVDDIYKDTPFTANAKPPPPAVTDSSIPAGATREMDDIAGVMQNQFSKPKPSSDSNILDATKKGGGKVAPDYKMTTPDSGNWPTEAQQFNAMAEQFRWKYHVNESGTDAGLDSKISELQGKTPGRYVNRENAGISEEFPDQPPGYLYDMPKQEVAPAASKASQSSSMAGRVLKYATIGKLASMIGGGPIGFGVAAVTGNLLGRLLKQHGGKAVDQLTSMTSKYGTRISDLMKDLTGQAGEALPSLTLPTTIAAMGNGKYDDHIKKIEALAENVREFNQNLDTNVKQYTDGVKMIDAAGGAAVENKIKTVMDYLNKSAPALQVLGLNNYMRPDDRSLLDFHNRYLGAVAPLASIAHAIKVGTMPQPTMDAIRNMWPDTYQFLQNMALRAMMQLKNDSTLSPARREILTKIMEVSMSKSLDGKYLNKMQQMYKQSQPSSAGGPPTTNNGGEALKLSVPQPTPGQMTAAPLYKGVQ